MAVEFGLPLRMVGGEMESTIGFPYRRLAAEEGVVFTDHFVYTPVGERSIIERVLTDLRPGVTEVRGRGLMIGIEFVRDRQTKERATTERDRVVRACFEHGLLVLGAGRNAIRLSPPLVLTRAEADTALRILDAAISACRSAA